MNQLQGIIERIETNDGLSIVTLDIGHGVSMHCIVIETPASADYLRTGYNVQIMFKETEVTLARSISPTNISTQNILHGSFLQADKNILLSSVIIDTSNGRIEAIITTKALEAMNLVQGEDISVLIKVNEIMLSS